VLFWWLNDSQERRKKSIFGHTTIASILLAIEPQKAEFELARPVVQARGGA